MTVSASISKKALPTYPLGQPERHPLFFEKRVYQGSSGKVYPVPFIDKVYDEPIDVSYQVATLENEYVYLEMLPEIGGRIFKGQDKTNANYDFFYRQDVIKPALVGLAGPWLSGGVEFNWPQHHRPGTYLPTDVYIEEEADGARTVWMSELDPLERMKGMHGIRLRPGSSLIELRARLYNRTPFTQTFLWWANVAAKVHDQYQSFFPPDVRYVADHAVRAMSSFPEANNLYYGIDYSARPGANDLSWYRNIPVPTSYMVCETEGGFFGGYDHAAGGGFVHVADRHISPGKKQWTWGNHEFGWAWDRELTDAGGPYVELMAGVYTDNQPDFSYLLPYETKTFSQFWWPIQTVGPVQEANELAAARLVVREDRSIDAAVLVASEMRGCRIVLREGERTLVDETADRRPGVPWRRLDLQLSGERAAALEIVVFDCDGRVALRYRPPSEEPGAASRSLATEPAEPAAVESAEELYLIGKHLQQYRHPTRDPERYWKEGLARDPQDLRCNLALGKAALKRGEFAVAQDFLDTAVSRSVRWHPNPESGQAHYFLGLALLYQQQLEAAYAAFYKATWNYEWRSAAYYELACIDMWRDELAIAIRHAELSLETNASHGKAIVLKAVALGRTGGKNEAIRILDTWLATDPLDPWAHCERARLRGSGWEAFRQGFRNDAQTILDIAFDYARLGAFAEATDLLRWHQRNETEPVAVPNPLQRSAMVGFALAWLLHQAGDSDAAQAALEDASQGDLDYFFPSRLEEQLALEWSQSQRPSLLAAYGLGNYYYDKRRHEHAIREWESAPEGESCAAICRNLGIAYWNRRRDGASARRLLESAIEVAPRDTRLFYEYDQLRKTLRDSASERLGSLEARRDLVLERDDLSVELATLLNEVGRHQDALALLSGRRFHPWEGGEGRVLRQYTLARLELGRALLADGSAAAALAQFDGALRTPPNLGEAYHPLQAKADVNYWRGRALAALGKTDEATAAFEEAAGERSDFQGMAVVAFSEMSYYSGLALRELGRELEADGLFRAMLSYVADQRNLSPKIDYFATSLPDMLVFEEDALVVRDARLDLLQGLAEDGLAWDVTQERTITKD